MEHFVGIDLHSNNSYIAIIDNDNKRVFKKKVRNDLQNVLHVLESHRKQIEKPCGNEDFLFYVRNSLGVKQTR